MKVKRRKAAAVTLIESMAAMAILAVGVLGASGYRYYAMLDARKASMQRTAAAIALLLCENWRGGGIAHTTDFDPVAQLSPELAITVSGSGPSLSADFTSRGSYQIVVEDVHYWATLCWKDLTSDLRALNVVIAWKQTGEEATTYGEDAKTFKLTTYVSNY
jgi:Tfp pilus assembly protein PilV